MNRALSTQAVFDAAQAAFRELNYRSGGIHYSLATEHEDAVLRSILRENSMDSWVQMTLEREPAYFAGENLMGQDAVILASLDKPPHDIIGMGAWGLRPVYLNGRVQNIGYMGHLRVSAAYRNRIRILKSSYRALQTFTAGFEPHWSFTSIASENNVALRMLNANIKGMPVYTPQGQYLTLAFSAAQRTRKTPVVELRSAQAADLPDLVAFHNNCASQWQFAPQLSERWLMSLAPEKGLVLDDFLLWRRDGRICACLAVWDQRAIKQTVARGYRFPINWLRPTYNVAAGLLHRLELPAVGQQLEQIYLAFAAFDSLPEEDVLGVFHAALARVRAKSARAAVIGMSVSNPLAEPLRRHFRAACYRSEIETVSWSRDPLPEVDGRPVQPEVALL